MLLSNKTKLKNHCTVVHQNYDLQQDDDSSNDDLNNDPDWKLKSVFNFNSSDDGIVTGTPPKVTETVTSLLLYSPKENWKVLSHTYDTAEKHTNLVTHSPATDKWIVEDKFETTHNKEPPVKRALFKDDNDPYKKPDAVRKNIKYKNIPEKDIDNCLSIWLSHAPFRLKKKNSKQPNKL
ncbi:uncharacterized protein LOC112599531 [Melanaphis sacchari]|uniref:uncharacterized protein LOC112599531 n=1 Tax=Melanaphis sacchari TaxID=742174 RepID=UPI000DC14D85|nr:uncharacterized protein LOC112599531 [Melanaphis sacchari]